MLFYKAWLETRWRFVIGLLLLTCSVGATVLAHPHVVRMLPLVPRLELGGELGRRVAEQLELVREYRGYVWSQWFRQNLPQLWSLFAVLLGTGGLVSQAAGGSGLFTLSLPVTRQRLLGTRAATGLLELLALAFAPSLLLPLLSPSVGQSYAFADALVHSACLFVAGSVFFSLAVLLSSVFGDLWRPITIALAAAFVMATLEQFLRGLPGVFGVMSAEAYFRGGAVPWPGLLASAAASSAMLYGAAWNVAQRDF
jgi:hypothetical protein